MVDVDLSSRWVCVLCESFVARFFNGFLEFRLFSFLWNWFVLLLVILRGFFNFFSDFFRLFEYDII